MGVVIGSFRAVPWEPCAAAGAFRGGLQDRRGTCIVQSSRDDFAALWTTSDGCVSAARAEDRMMHQAQKRIGNHVTLEANLEDIARSIEDGIHGVLLSSFEPGRLIPPECALVV